MAKINKLFSKIMVISFLVLMVLGFTIPGFLYAPEENTGSSSSQQPEARLCHSDADCYLICDGKPLPVICLQNLCQQSQCGYSYYDYSPESPVKFKLEIILDSGTPDQPKVENIDLILKNNPQNFFVIFATDGVSLYSPRLSLGLILQRLGISFLPTCLNVDGKEYCNNDNYQFIITINGQELAEVGDYIPSEDDQISISYLPRNPIN